MLLKTCTASAPAASAVAIVVVARKTSTAIAQVGNVSLGVSSGVWKIDSFTSEGWRLKS